MLKKAYIVYFQIWWKRGFNSPNLTQKKKVAIY